MTRRQLVARIERWRLLLAPEWRITLCDGAPEGRSPDEFHACIAPSEDYLHASLWFNPARLDDPVGEIDVTIIHELLHLLTHEMRRVLDDVQGQIHRDAHAIVSERFKSEEERAVERVARVIARLEHPDGLLYGVDDPNHS